jgi:hypothetical protein
VSTSKQRARHKLNKRLAAHDVIDLASRELDTLGYLPEQTFRELQIKVQRVVAK